MAYKIEEMTDHVMREARKQLSMPRRELAELLGGLCQRKVTLRGTSPALALRDEKSVPLFQDFAGNHPTRRHDVREVSALPASGRRLAP